MLLPGQGLVAHQRVEHTSPNEVDHPDGQYQIRAIARSLVHEQVADRCLARGAIEKPDIDGFDGSPLRLLCIRFAHQGHHGCGHDLACHDIKLSQRLHPGRRLDQADLEPHRDGFAAQPGECIHHLNVGGAGHDHGDD